VRAVPASLLPALRRLAAAPLARGLPVLLALLLGASWLPGGTAMAGAAGDAPAHATAAAADMPPDRHGDCAGPTATDADSGIAPADDGGCCDPSACACMAGGAASPSAPARFALVEGIATPAVAMPAAGLPAAELPRPLRPPIA
jgi:hypothetical protein